MKQEEQLLSLKEVVDILGLTRESESGVETLRRWIKAGDIAAVKLPGRAGYRIARSELDRFVLARQVRAEVGKSIA